MDARRKSPVIKKRTRIPRLSTIKRMEAKKPLTLIDLFAGCGGLSLGLERAGFTPIFVNELNADAMETYLANREDTNPLLRSERYHINDVKEMVRGHFLNDLRRNLRADWKIEDEEIDLLVGGPPCQGFSGIGHRRSYSVDKKELPSNHLYRDMAAVIRGLRPRAFVFENVRGLLVGRWTPEGRKGEIWDDVLETFQSLKGYNVASQLIYAKDYGVPQNRPRVLIVGIRKDVDFKPKFGLDAIQQGFIPPPIGHPPPDLVDVLGDLEDEHYLNGVVTRAYPRSAKSPFQRMVRMKKDGCSIAAKGDPLSDQEYSAHSPRIIEKFEAMQENGGVIPERFKTKKFAQRVLPPHWNGKGPTITATSLAEDYVHYSQPRSLTVREWARIQMFPDWYRFAGKRTTGGLRRAGNPRAGIFDRELPKYTQIGNAVPVGLAEQIGLHIAGILQK